VFKSIFAKLMFFKQHRVSSLRQYAVPIRLVFNSCSADYN